MMSVTTRAVAFAKLWLFSFVVAIGLLAAGHASADGRPFSRIVIFGDSLSDSGNLFALGPLLGLDAPGSPTNNWSMADDGPTDDELLTLIPDQAYVSRRLSNGPTWVELLGTALGRARNVKPAFGSTDLHALNFAVAGATASNFGSLPDNFNLSGQVGAFLARADQIGTTSDTLYVIAIGGNDMRAALAGAATPEAVFAAALESLASNIGALYGKGAKKIIIWNAPDLGRTPAIQRVAAFECSKFSLPPDQQRLCIQGVAQNVSGLSVVFNEKLEELLGGLETSLGIEFIRFDAFGLLIEVQENKARYGLRNAVDACVEPFVGPDFKCDQPDRYFFWDGIHPTRVGHAIIAFLNGKALVQALHE